MLPTGAAERSKWIIKVENELYLIRRSAFVVIVLIWGVSSCMQRDLLHVLLCTIKFLTLSKLDSRLLNI